MEGYKSLIKESWGHISASSSSSTTLLSCTALARWIFPAHKLWGDAQMLQSTSKNGCEEATQAPAASSPHTIYHQQRHAPRSSSKRELERKTRSSLIYLGGSFGTSCHQSSQKFQLNCYNEKEIFFYTGVIRCCHSGMRGCALRY